MFELPDVVTHPCTVEAEVVSFARSAPPHHVILRRVAGTWRYSARLEAAEPKSSNANSPPEPSALLGMIAVSFDSTTGALVWTACRQNWSTSEAAAAALLIAWTERQAVIAREGVALAGAAEVAADAYLADAADDLTAEVGNIKAPAAPETLEPEPQDTQPEPAPAAPPSKPRKPRAKS